MSGTPAFAAPRGELYNTPCALSDPLYSPMAVIPEGRGIKGERLLRLWTLADVNHPKVHSVAFKDVASPVEQPGPEFSKRS